jgi:hypothetical protein
MGFSWRKFIEIAQIVGPAALTVAGVPAAVIPLVVHGITIAEETAAKRDTDGKMTGQEKKALAMDVVQTGLSAVNATASKQLIDVDQISHVVSQGIDTTIEAINAAHNIPVHSSPVV